MTAIRVELPEGARLELETPRSARELLEQAGLGDGAIAVRLDGRAASLDSRIASDCRIEPIQAGSRDGLAILRRTEALLLARAAERLFGGVEPAALAALPDGFSVDLDLEHVIRVEDLALLEEEMQSIRAADLPIETVRLPREEAERELRRHRSKFRSEVLHESPAAEFEFVRIGGDLEMAEGPWLPSTGRAGPARLLSVSGAYWKDSETRPMLQRVHGTAFARPEELERHLAALESARERDHRKLGRQLDLFSFHPEAPGFPFWHPRGVRLLDRLEGYLKSKLLEDGFQTVRTPVLLGESVWRLSGHWEIYRENMFLAEDGSRTYGVKPMNCPGASILYRATRRSFRELPLRFAELGHVHRNERSGVLSGLLRARSFTQDDGHIFCAETDLGAEIRGILSRMLSVYADFGFTRPVVELSTRPIRSLGSEDNWRRAEAALRSVLDSLGIEHDVHRGEGSFYGPKIDVHLPDCLGRLWQAGTIQVDFAMPERFELTYVGPDERHRRPVLIHRAVTGSLERLAALLIEHHSGAFPTWLAPEQVRIVPVSPVEHGEYASAVAREIVATGAAAEVDARGETVGYRVRQAALDKVPYSIVVGDEERAARTVSVRRRDGEDLGAVATKVFAAELAGEIARREACPGIRFAR